MSLWRSDGTRDGTYRLWRGPAREIAIVVQDGTLALTTTPGPGASTVWLNDGTPRGTAKVTAARGRSLGLTGGEVVSAGPNLFFYADDGLHGAELWALPVDLPRAGT